MGYRTLGRVELNLAIANMKYDPHSKRIDACDKAIKLFREEERRTGQPVIMEVRVPSELYYEIFPNQY